ncbi:sulfurtransferase [Myxococcus sp. K15C18031901]|uniref:sulfurtransferase n=1 Tax=Myxococcus dinghuensis TaxID=2906761 RepID=UPI0020A82368|nr:sulfurtransferase [Myxococcus dinghuensis]MCP3102297.1 sulfurtransferase [Myxococcus dinghuensis]
MTSLRLPGPTVSVHWLAEHLGHPRLILLDASLKPSTTAASVPSPASSVQVPGTRSFDFDKRICDQETPLPHMMPPPALFEREVRALGVRRDSVLVIHDRMGVYASPRAWWMFKAMGHEQVAVLDGGLPAWLEANLPTEPVGTPPVEPGDFVAQPHPGLFCDAEHVEAALSDPRYVVLDARSEGRFLGREPEPRAGLRPGHMPNAVNLHFGQVQANGRMRTAEELAAIFASKAGRQQKLIFSCGSGVTACILTLAAELAGYPALAVYDGSWSEWGLPSARPVVTDAGPSGRTP